MSLLGIEAMMRERLGLDPGSLGSSVLRQAVEARMKARGVTTHDAYLGILVVNPAEADTLAAELVVAETWFFRGGRALFSRLAEFVANRVVARTSHQPLRILSIPCSTGEEPYSLAIAFHEHSIPPERYRIDAVDVSPRHIERANAGSYPSFAFREGGPDIRPAYFRQIGDRWELLPYLRESVHFRVESLTSPGFLSGEPTYDLILCRNVFIYLTPDARKQAMASLDRLLASDGMLCLTPGEADRLLPGKFALADPGEPGLYRRTTANESHATTPTPKLLGYAKPRPLPPPPPRPEPLTPPLGSMIPLLTPRLEHGTDNALEEARELADAGKLTEARTACERVIRESGASAAAYTLLGVIQQAEGNRDDAAEAFRRALYLDPEHAEAISHMIVICERKGQHSQAEALRRRLAKLPREDAK